MTATAPATRTPGQVLRSLDWRAVLVVVATVGVVLEAPVWLRGPLTAAAAIGAITFCLPRRRRREPLDTALAVFGGIAVVLVVLGLLLNLLPTGLTAMAWGIAIGVIELAAMILFAFREPVAAARRPREDGASVPRRAVVASIWGVLVLGVLTVALVLSIGSYDRTHIPPVALGAQTSGGTTVVSIDSGRDADGLELRLVDADGRSTVLASDIAVGPGRAAEKVRVPASTVGRLELVRDGSTRPLRTLILDGSGTTGNG